MNLFSHAALFYAAKPQNQVNTRSCLCRWLARQVEVAVLMILLFVVSGCDQAKKLADNAVDKVKKDFESAKNKIEKASQPKVAKGSNRLPTSNSPKSKSGSTPPKQTTMTLDKFKELAPSAIRDRHIEALAKDPEVAAKITKLNLFGSGISAQGLQMLSRFPQLEELDLSRVRATAGNMKHVGSLTSLKSLVLADNSLTDNDFLQIAGLTKLEQINIQGNRITDNGFQCFSQMANLSKMWVGGLKQLEGKGFKYINKNSLKELYGEGSSIGLAAFDGLAGSESLELIWLIRARVTDKTMQKIGRCKNLREVFLDQNDLTDKGISYLRNCVTIENLNLAKNRRLGDDTIKYFIRMKALKSLNMVGNQCSLSAKAEMEKHLPNCSFVF